MTEPGADFPFFNGLPRALGPAGMVVILAGCVAGFSALVFLPKAIAGHLGEWAGAIAFVLLQIAGLFLATGSAWTAIFRRLTRRQVLIAVACVPLVIVLPAMVGWFVVGSANLASNPAIEGMAVLSAPAAINKFVVAAVQLLGEELITVLPFLVLLTVFHRLGMNRRLAIGVAGLVTSLAFGALHLSTYEWHVGQALLVIGAARVVLTFVYVFTRNVWASTLTHVINDWTLLAITLLGTAVR